MKSRKFIGIFTILSVFPIIFGILLVQMWGGSEEAQEGFMSGMWLTVFIRCYLATAAGLLIFSGKKLGYQLGVAVWGYIILVNLMDSVTLFGLAESFAFIKILAVGQITLYLGVSSIPFYILTRDLYLLKSIHSDNKPKLEISKLFWGIYTAFFASAYLGGVSLFQNKDEGYVEQESAEIHWHVLDLPPPASNDERLLDIIWDGKQFILTGESNFLMTSPNGIDWQKTDSSARYNLEYLIYKDKRYVATSDYYIKTSNDGICWQDVENSPRSASNVITNGSHFFYASADKMYRSTDGVDWMVIADTQFEKIPVLRWNGAAIIAEAYQKRWFSLDGKEWNRLSTIREWLTTWKGKLYSTNSTGSVSRTSSAISDFVLDVSESDSLSGKQDNIKGSKSSWDSVLRPKHRSFVPSTDGILVVNDMLFAFGDHISWSEDGDAWGGVALPSEIKSSVKKLVYGNGVYVAIAREQMILGVSSAENSKLEPLIIQTNARNIMAREEIVNREKMLRNYDLMSLTERTELYYYPDGFFQSNKRKFAEPTLKNKDGLTGTKDGTKDEDVTEDSSKKNSPPNILKVLFENHPEIYERLNKEVVAATADSEGGASISTVQTILEKNSFSFFYDSEAGTYPVPYGWLLSEYAVMAKNYGIEIKNTSMEMVKNHCGDKELYRLRWSINDTTYGLDFYDDSDWFSGAAENALNTSLFEQGYQARFVGLDTGDQIINYVLAKPELIEKSGLYQPK